MSEDASYIPKTIPYDECRKFYDCEKNPTECKYYKEYVDPAFTEAKQGGPESKAAQAQIETLQQLAICVEKFQSKPVTAESAQEVTKYQQAAFLLSTLWGVKDTIKISFMDVPANYPGDQPQWDGSKKVPPTTRKPTEASMAAANAGDFGGKKLTQNLMPLWYTRDLVFSNMKPGVTLSPEDEELEKRVRAMDPIDAIQTIVKERIQPLIGLKLEFVASEGDIRIALDNRKGAWSMVGVQCRTVEPEKPTMNFGWLDVATIIHEFCHALGMIHEHQNPFGKGIDWNMKNVFAWANSTQGWNMYTTCQNITKRYAQDLVNGSDYDPESIMLYSYPAIVTNNNQPTYRNVTLSAQDKLWMSSIYPPDGKPRSFPQRSLYQQAQDIVKQYHHRTYGLVIAGVLGIGSMGLLYARLRRRR